jgi:hypothetical protein
MKLDVSKFGILRCRLCAGVFFLDGVAVALFGWRGAMAEMIGSFYLGFGPTLGGALIGTLWGFAVGFVFFALAVWSTTGSSASAGTGKSWVGLRARPTDAIKGSKVESRARP